jgi:hypothetical protein
MPPYIRANNDFFLPRAGGTSIMTGGTETNNMTDTKRTFTRLGEAVVGRGLRTPPRVGATRRVAQNKGRPWRASARAAGGEKL